MAQRLVPFPISNFQKTKLRIGNGKYGIGSREKEIGSRK